MFIKAWMFSLALWRRKIYSLPFMAFFMERKVMIFVYCLVRRNVFIWTKLLSSLDVWKWKLSEIFFIYCLYQCSAEGWNHEWWIRYSCSHHSPVFFLGYPPASVPASRFSPTGNNDGAVDIDDAINDDDEGDDGAVDIDDALNDDPESSFQFQTTELTSQYNDQIQRDTEAR